MKKLLLLKQPVAGFSMIETIVTVSIFALISAIAIPSYLNLVSQQRLSAAQDAVSIMLRNSQASAKRQGNTFQACFQDTGTQVRSAIQFVPNGTANCNDPSVNWQPLISVAESQLLSINTTKTTLPSGPSGYYKVPYQSDGRIDTSVVTPPQKITLVLRNQNSSAQRCVFVQTLLGAISTNADNNCN